MRHQIRGRISERREAELGHSDVCGKNPAYGAAIHYYFGRPPRQTPLLTITDEHGETVAQTQGFTQPGLHKLSWLLNVKGTKRGTYNPVRSGTYHVSLEIGQRKLTKTVVVENED